MLEGEKTHQESITLAFRKSHTRAVITRELLVSHVDILGIQGSQKPN